jgi:hypothetical protein
MNLAYIRASDSLGVPTDVFRFLQNNGYEHHINHDGTTLWFVCDDQARSKIEPVVRAHLATGRRLVVRGAVKDSDPQVIITWIE